MPFGPILESGSVSCRMELLINATDVVYSIVRRHLFFGLKDTAILKGIAMAVPTHRYGCETRLWATICPDCGQRVFFFSCSCGSKVFFDLPVPPWNPHADSCVYYLIRILRDVEQRSATEVRKLVEDYASDNQLEIPRDVYRKLLADENKERGSATIIEVLPESTEQVFEGAITAINMSVNFFKRLGYPENVISTGILGDLAAEPYVEVVIRADRDPDTGFCHQVTCFYPRAMFEAGGLAHGRRVFAHLQVVSLPNGMEVWVAEDIYGR